MQSSQIQTGAEVQRRFAASSSSVRPTVASQAREGAGRVAPAVTSHQDGDALVERATPPSSLVHAPAPLLVVSPASPRRGTSPTRGSEALATAAAVAAVNAEAAPLRVPPPLPVDAAARKFALAQRAIIFLDYDGTLAPWVPNPADARPTPALKATLKRLADLAQVEVAIISARAQADMQSWLGDLPISMVAEHGALRKLKGAGQWTPIAGTCDTAWMDRARRIMAEPAYSLAGHLVEGKTTGLAWHYRNIVDQEAALAAATQLKAALEEALGDLGLEVTPPDDSKVIEVRHRGVDKGGAVEALLQHFQSAGPAFDFVMAAGDAATDEDMFKALPATAPANLTIKVRPEASRAHYSVANTVEMCQFLDKLAAAV